MELRWCNNMCSHLLFGILKGCFLNPDGEQQSHCSGWVLWPMGLFFHICKHLYVFYIITFDECSQNARNSKAKADEKIQSAHRMMEIYLTSIVDVVIILTGIVICLVYVWNWRSSHIKRISMQIILAECILGEHGIPSTNW